MASVIKYNENPISEHAIEAVKSLRFWVSVSNSIHARDHASFKIK